MIITMLIPDNGNENEQRVNYSVLEYFEVFFFYFTRIKSLKKIRQVLGVHEHDFFM